MSTQVPFSISFTPRGGALVALVPVGGWLAEMPAFDAEQRVYEAPGMATENEFFKPLGGATMAFALAMELAVETQSAARVAFLAHTLPLHGVLTFTGDTWAVEMPAAMTAADAGLPSGTAEPTVIRSYRVAASAAITLTEDEE